MRLPSSSGRGISLLSFLCIGLETLSLKFNFAFKVGMFSLEVISSFGEIGLGSARIQLNEK